MARSRNPLEKHVLKNKIKQIQCYNLKKNTHNIAWSNKYMALKLFDKTISQ